MTRLSMAVTIIAREPDGSTNPPISIKFDPPDPSGVGQGVGAEHPHKGLCGVCILEDVENIRRLHRRGRVCVDCAEDAPDRRHQVRCEGDISVLARRSGEVFCDFRRVSMGEDVVGPDAVGGFRVDGAGRRRSARPRNSRLRVDDDPPGRDGPPGREAAPGPGWPRWGNIPDSPQRRLLVFPPGTVPEVRTRSAPAAPGRYGARTMFRTRTHRESENQRSGPQPGYSPGPAR